MSTSLDRALEIETHHAHLCRLGFRPENLARHEKRIAALTAERSRLRQQDLDAAVLLAKMTAPKLREPSCLQAMSCDQYFDGRGQLREQRNVTGHH